MVVMSASQQCDGRERRARAGGIDEWKLKVAIVLMSGVTHTALSGVAGRASRRGTALRDGVDQPVARQI